MNEPIEPNIIYPTLRDAAAAVCKRWCEEQGYKDHFYQNGSWWAFPPNSVMPVNIHQVIDRKQTKAQRVKIKHYSTPLSIALFPDGCIAPHEHPEI